MAISPQKHLIVNADDFGLTEDINHGIMESHLNGIVTSVSIMPTGNAFNHAVRLLQDNSGLGVGIHLSLTETAPVLSAETVPTLVDHEQTQPSFPRGLQNITWRLLSGKISMSEVKQEWDAQIKKTLLAGLNPTHLDSHQHIHIFPGLWKIIDQLAVKYHIGFRFPLEKKLGWASNIHFKKWCISLCLLFAKQDKNLNRVDHFLGLNFSGKLNEENLTHYLSALNRGVTELMCHPGDNAPEREALTAPDIIRLIRTLDVNLTNDRSCYG